MGDDVARLAADLVYWSSQGTCPLDGPCEDCDCWDPAHHLERAQAAFLVGRGWHFAVRTGDRVFTVGTAPEGSTQKLGAVSDLPD
jgi:hypothetical protein